MGKKELIYKINESLNQVYLNYKDEIVNVIKYTIENIKGDTKKNIQEIHCKTDLDTGFHIPGFYMIFNTDPDAANHCKCKIEYKDCQYNCVYRGQAYCIKDRLISHLFYTVDGKYDNCMKIKLNNKNYNINISDKKLFCDDKVQPPDIGFPDWAWLVIKITLSNTKQGTREMFETAFDEAYGKPIYSVK